MELYAIISMQTNHPIKSHSIDIEKTSHVIVKKGNFPKLIKIDNNFESKPWFYIIN